MDQVDDPAPTTTADLVLTGGTVLTFDPEDTVGAALAVRRGRVQAVGEAAEVARHIGTTTRVIDLDGRTVIPGINDSHLHATWLGALWPRTVLSEGSAPGPPTRLLRDTGDRRRAILRGSEICASLGITSYTEPGLGPGEDDGETGCFGQAVLDEYAALARERRLRSRVTVLRLFGLLDGPCTLDAFERGLATEPASSDPAWLGVTGVKIFADGIPPMTTAWTYHRYRDGTSGGLLVEGATLHEKESNLRRMFELAHEAGVQIGVHATGDRSVEVAIDALEHGVRRHGRAGRHYIVHGDLVSGWQLARMRDSGIGLTVQPGIALATAEMVTRVLGDRVTAKAWPLRAMLASDVKLTLSSDAPILAPDWRAQVAAAATWMGVSGSDPELATQLLRCYTTRPAAQDGAEHRKGSLEPGKYADLCVLARNPLTAPIADLASIPVDATVVDGRFTFVRAGQLRGVQAQNPATTSKSDRHEGTAGLAGP